MDNYIKTKPYKHQMEALDFSKDKRAAALLLEMGTGKTKLLIDTANYLYREGEITHVLVVSPNSIKSTWEEEIATHSLLPYDIFTVEAPKRDKASSWMKEVPSDEPHIQWMIMAIESLSQGKAYLLMEEFISANYDNMMMVIDESSTIKNYKASRTKRVIKYGKHIKYKRILSGSPITRGIEDLYTQYYFIDRKIIDMDSYFAFRNRHCIMGGFQAKKVIGYRNEDKLMKLLNPHTFQVRKEDALDLPDKVYETRYIELSAEQKRAYNSMRKDLVALIESRYITAEVAVTKLLRLQQIVGGFVKFEETNSMDDKIVIFEKVGSTNPKINEVLEIIKLNDAKTIIWCRFIAEIEAVHDALIDAGILAVKAHGKVKQKDRDARRHAFQNDPLIKVYVGQPEGGGMGITLTAASQVIYFSNSFSSVARIQSEDRCHRIGQKNKVTYIDLIAKNTVDVQIILSLRKKIDFSKTVMQSIENGSWREII